MKRSFRKLNQHDFTSRVARVENMYNRRTPYYRRRDKSGERPLFWAVVSLMWSYMALMLAFNRPKVEVALEGSLPRHMHDPAMATIAAGLSVSIILLAYHILRGIVRARGYYNSGSILIGFLIAVGMHITPANMYRSAYDLLDGETQIALESTVKKVSNVDWDEVRIVSSEAGMMPVIFDNCQSANTAAPKPSC